MSRSGFVSLCVVGVLATWSASAAPIQPDDPSLNANLKLWLKADALTLADGASVSTWTDSSSNGNDAAAVYPTGLYVAPTFRASGIGTLPTVYFSRTNRELLEATNLYGGSAVGNGSIVALYRINDPVGDRGLDRPVGFGASAVDGGSPTNAHWNLATDPSSRFDGSAIPPSSYIQTHPTDVYLLRTATKGGQTFADHFDGAVALPSTTHGTTLTVVDDFYLGDLHNAAATGVSNVDVAEVVVYNKVLSATERQGVEEYLLDKYTKTRGYWRFENGTAGAPDPGTPGNVLDTSYFANHGTAKSYTGSDKPVYSSDVPAPGVPLTGAANTLSLDFERDHSQYVEVADDPSISFGNNPFTLEACVKLETLGNNSTAGRQYVLFKKHTYGVTDAYREYGFLAQAGNTVPSKPNALVLQLGKGSAGGPNATIVSDLEITDTEWHYISAAFDPDADTVRFTLDWEVDFQPTAFVPGTNDGPLIIGAHFNSAGAVEPTFDGLIDEIRISRGFLPFKDLLVAPEPASLGLLGLGLAALLRRRRRR